MSKIVTSMLRVFGVHRNPKEGGGIDSARKTRKSILDADSFVFMPGEDGKYWGDMVTSRHGEGVPVPISHFAGDYSAHRRRRAKTAAHGGESARREARRKVMSSADDALIFGDVKISRRLSGTLVKAGKTVTDEVEDSGGILLESENRERWSPDLSGRYVYDRLLRVPTSTPTQSKSNSQNEREREIEKETGQRKVVDPDERSLVFQVRCDTSGYCDLVPLSEYYSPADAVDWDQVRVDTWRATAGDYAEVRESDASPVLGKAFSEHDVQLLDKIGEGQFGDVRKGLISPDTDDEQVVAIKTCKPDASHEERTKFLEEAAVMRKFNHPHIIKLFGVMSSRQMTYIIMELAPLGQLRRYLLTEGSRISKTTLLDYIHQLSSAMVHLESKNYVHRDIAARNVLVVTPQVVKLADFGLSRGLNDDADYYVASRGKLPIKWMAPESINFRRFTGLSDVWMFGVCCWEILMRGVKPFVGIKNDEVISKIELGERLPLPPDCPASLFRLMNSLWQYDPQDRPHFVEVEHTISEIDEEERQLTFMTQRRLYAGMQPTPNTPEKPPRSNPSSSSSLYQRVPSDPQVITREDEGNDVGDNNPLPLPPRVADRFREFSISPQPPDSISALGMDSDATGPPKPPRRMPRSVSGEHANRLSGGSQGNHFSGVDRELPFPPPPPIVPYSVTTITPIDPDIPTSHPSQRRSESPPMIMTLPIPPPPILHQPWRTENDSAGVYYSVPSDMSETGTSRVLSEHGTFVDQEMRTSTSYSSVESGRDGGGLRPRLGEGRPLSHASTEESSDRSSFVEERQDDFVPPEDDPVLQQTTVVVKAVMELSNKVPLSRPTDYVEFVKNVGLALRDLLSKVDEVLQDLPQQTHQEVSMAHKVLSSDMAHLVEAMKNAQKHHQTFLEQEYRKQMFQAAHIVAVNSKQLMDAVNSARRKAHLMQR